LIIRGLQRSFSQFHCRYEQSKCKGKVSNFFNCRSKRWTSIPYGPDCNTTASDPDALYRCYNHLSSLGWLVFRPLLDPGYSKLGDYSDKGGYVVDVFPTKGSLTQRLQELQAGGFFDEFTGAVEVVFNLYNPTTQFMTVVEVGRTFVPLEINKTLAHSCSQKTISKNSSSFIGWFFFCFFCFFVSFFFLKKKSDFYISVFLCPFPPPPSSCLGCKSIQAMISFHETAYIDTNYRTYPVLTHPYGTHTVVKVVSQVIFLSFVVYFVVIEMKELGEAGWRYFRDFWNFVELISLSLFMVLTVRNISPSPFKFIAIFSLNSFFRPWL
jgi:hypothetical protein